jgi:anaerobic selenocysteine-containing dehydrogenase
VLGIRGADHDVFSAGYICPKGYALKDLHEDPDRLRTPLIKRDGRFVEASWDEAFAEIERRLVPVLEQHGRDAVACAPWATPRRTSTGCCCTSRGWPRRWARRTCSRPPRSTRCPSS